MAGGSLDLRAAEFWIGWRGGRWQLRARAVYDEKRMEGGREEEECGSGTLQQVRAADKEQSGVGTLPSLSSAAELLLLSVLPMLRGKHGSNTS